MRKGIVLEPEIATDRIRGEGSGPTGSIAETAAAAAAETFIVDPCPGGQKDIRNFLFDYSYRLISRA